MLKKILIPCKEHISQKADEWKYATAGLFNMFKAANELIGQSTTSNFRWPRQRRRKISKIWGGAAGHVWFMAAQNMWKSAWLKCNTLQGPRVQTNMKGLSMSQARMFIYCHVPAGWGLQQNTRAPGSKKTLGQWSFGPLTGGLNLTNLVIQQTTRAPGSDKTWGQWSFGPLTGGLNLTNLVILPKNLKRGMDHTLDPLY